MGDIEYPYVDQNVVTTTPLHESLFNKIDGQLVGLTERIGGTWTDATRPTPSEGVPHPIGWNTDRASYELWDGAAWVQIAVAGGGSGPSPLDFLCTCEESIQLRDMVAQSTTANKVILASANNILTEALGCVYSKPTTTTALVRSLGEVKGFAGLTPRDRIFLSTVPGEYLINPDFNPIPPEYKIIQELGVAVSATTIVVAMSHTIQIE